jgi:hypothetical protein
MGMMSDRIRKEEYHGKRSLLGKGVYIKIQEINRM